MTGFPPAVMGLVAERHRGICEMCNASRVQHHHHRRPRGAGGSRRPDTNLASNCLGLCAPCHHVVETNRHLATLLGWLVPQGFSPETQPVLRRGEWVYLEPNGEFRYTDEDFTEYTPYRGETVVKVREEFL